MDSSKLNLNKSNYAVASWFVYKNILSFFMKVLGTGVQHAKVVSGFDLEIVVVSKNLYPVILFLHKHSLCQFKTMIDIACYDTPGKKNRFCLSYNLLSIKYNTRINVVSKVTEFSQVLSLISLYKSVGWSEREIFDFFGLFFFENNDLRRILTDYGFRGFPLRKDFPLTGYVDSFYDDNQKRVCYRSLELSQEYRNFNFKSNWRFNT